MYFCEKTDIFLECYSTYILCCFERVSQLDFGLKQLDIVDMTKSYMKTRK